VARQFDGPVKLKVHLAPPLFAERDPDTGQLKKRAYGAWVLRAMALLARAKRLRGTRWDPFGRSEERRAERQLIESYMATVDELIAGLGPDSHALAVEIARVPEQIRGYGHVKAAAISAAKAREAELLARFRAGPELKSAAE
ncbi:MAG: indolepyruvate ferredoxin oxidoreductase family protein, partial [Rhodospirillaceae bacterium]|nr:indolepyruvate ferredoxin oxidoreductase family protein [Rhodospirillaceae bacterium]